MCGAGAKDGQAQGIEAYSFVITAVVNGKVVYEKGKEALYRHITRPKN